MSVYREKNIWKRNLLVLRRSLPVLLGMAGLILIAFPLSFLPDLIENEMVEARSKGLGMIHGLLLLGSLLPCLALLPYWTEENSSELLHAAVKIRAPRLVELLWILRFYFLIVLVPIATACVLLQLSLLELLRMMLELLLVFGLYYLLLSLLQSALLGAMTLTIYILFCLLECRSAPQKNFCLIRPDLPYYNGFFEHEGVLLLPAAVLCGLVGYFIEKETPGINR